MMQLQQLRQQLRKPPQQQLNRQAQRPVVTQPLPELHKQPHNHLQQVSN